MQPCASRWRRGLFFTLATQQQTISAPPFQKTLKHTRFGRISVKCYYDASEQRLTVEILHAADIIALDANGTAGKKKKKKKRSC